MQIEFDGDWRFILVLAGLGLAVFLILGAVFGLAAGLLVFIFRSLWLFLKFSFSSIFGIVLLGFLAYIGYRAYHRLAKGDRDSDKTIEYTNDDFER